MSNFRVLKLIICLICLNFTQACGVKGKPHPPKTPPYIGKGINATPTDNKDNIGELNSGQKK